MFWSNSKDEESTEPDNHNGGPLSNQSQMISNALRQADKAMKQANYVFSEGTKGAATINDPNLSDGNNSSEEEEEASSYGGETMNDSTIRTGVDAQQTKASAPTGGSSKSSLNLRRNDTQFHVIAGLIVAKFEHFLTSGAQSFAVSVGDKQQLDRMVSRDNFVEAVRYRLQSCPERSMKPIHTLTRQCKALGLHRSGNQNLLYAPAGAIIQIEKLQTPEQDENTTVYTKGDDNCTTTATESQYAKSPAFCIGRDQIMAELREASNLMAESVTPEAAQFWRQHVVELQKRLQAVQHSTSKPGPTSGSIAMGVGCNERLLSSLNQITNYVPPTQEELSQFTESSVPAATAAQAKKPHITHRSKPKKKEPTTNALDPELQGLPMIDVVAPANLPEGYTFEAEIDDCRFIATVPSGGVRKGETFSCYMRDMDKLSDSDIPTRNWRDSLFSCFANGPTHPMFLNSFFCPLMALSQIMTRMGLDFMGLQGSDIPRTGIWSTQGMTNTIIVFWFFLNALIFVGFHIKDVQGIPISGADVSAFVLVNVGMFVYMVYAASNTRAIIRETYKIRDHYCGDLEDIISTAVCMPCSVAQMGRHTIAYEEHKALCCSDTGLEEGVEADITARPHAGSYRLW